MNGEKPKVKEFKLGPEFDDLGEFKEIERIYTIGKTLVLEHYTGETIQSSFYNDDLMKTAKTLRNALIGNSAIKLDFNIDKFIQVFSRLLVRCVLKEAQEHESQVKEEQQQKSVIEEEINQLREQNKDITHEEWISKLEDRYQNLNTVVDDTMPEIWPGLKFELSVSKILDIEGCTLPFIGVILGRPSSYKTVIIELLKKWPNTFYTDNFTARSFVSHSTSVSSEELEQIDMLPRLKDRVFLTPELSPMFTTKEEDLIQLLGIVTRIADGHGYSSDSGAHGHRGYDEEIMFTWVGAAVDIPYKVYKIMNNLGSRLYFFRMQLDQESIDQLLEYATTGEDFNDKKLKIQSALFDFLKWFEIGPSLQPNGKMKWDYSQDDREALKIIAGMADVLSYLRCIARVWETKDTQGSEYAYSISQREVPRRAVTALSNLARGHALLKGRNYITSEDISIVIKTALDTAQIERVSLFNLLIAYNGNLNTNLILESLNVSRPTALRTMAEFKAIGLVDIEDFHEEGQNNLSKKMVLNPRFEWLISVIKKNYPHTTTLFSTEEAQGNNAVTKEIENPSIAISQPIMQDNTFHTRWGNGALYRYGHTDIHGCNHCNLRGDIHFMRKHECSSKK